MPLERQEGIEIEAKKMATKNKKSRAKIEAAAMAKIRKRDEMLEAASKRAAAINGKKKTKFAEKVLALSAKLGLEPVAEEGEPAMRKGPRSIINTFSEFSWKPRPDADATSCAASCAELPTSVCGDNYRGIKPSSEGASSSKKENLKRPAAGWEVLEEDGGSSSWQLCTAPKKNAWKVAKKCE